MRKPRARSASDNQPVLSRNYIVRAVNAVGAAEKSFFVQVLLHDLTFRSQSTSFVMEFNNYSKSGLKVGDRVNITIGKMPSRPARTEPVSDREVVASLIKD